MRGTDGRSLAGTDPSVADEKASEKWTETHRNVMRKLVVEGGCVQNRFFDIGWSDQEVCQGCQEEEGTEKHRTHHRPAWRDARNQVPEEPRKWEQKANTSKED